MTIPIVIVYIASTPSTVSNCHLLYTAAVLKLFASFFLPFLLAQFQVRTIYAMSRRRTILGILMVLLLLWRTFVRKRTKCLVMILVSMFKIIDGIKQPVGVCFLVLSLLLLW